MRRIRVSLLAFWIALFAVSLARMDVRAQGNEPLVSLDASKLPEGPLAAWENAGTLKGSFKNDGTNPQVKVVDGVKAVDFGGKDHMLADFKAPAGITGDKPWTCIVRVYARDASFERTMLSWSNRPDNCLEIEYGSAALYGALGTWNGTNTTGWGNGLPKEKQWHTLVYTYHGGKDGEFQAWCDGEMRVSKKFSLATKADRYFVLGACMTGGDNPNDRPGYTHQIDGALASVKIYDRPMSPVEIWNVSGFNSACQTAPLRDAILQDISTTLKWEAGARNVVSFDVYAGTDRAEVEKAEKTQPAARSGDWRNVFKGNIPAPTTEFGPLPLNVGTTYYWRVDQRDSAGKVAQRGVVAKFSVETGNATDPAPADSYIFVEGGKQAFQWKPGKYAVKQNVYVGESAESVLSAKKPALADLPATALSADLPIKSPVLGKTYYWRVESVNPDNVSVSPGVVWSFRTVSKKLKVYLLGGQSNAVGCASVAGLPENLKGPQKGAIIFVRGECKLGPYGWASLREGLGSAFGDRDGIGTIGPELTFGVNMAPSKPDQVIAILKCAWGGTNLGAQWRPPSAGGRTGELYTNFVKAVHEGMAALDPAFEPEIAGMIWMQGESDTGDTTMANDYAKNLTCLIKDIRAEFKKPDMPFVLAQINKAPAWEAKNLGVVVRAAEEQVAKKVPNTATFPTDDYKMSDPWHYDTAGYVSLGERFAAAMKRLEQGAKK